MQRPASFPFVTIGFIVALVIGHVATMTYGIPIDWDPTGLRRQWVYQTPQEVWQGGYWTLITGAFVHAGPVAFASDLYLLADAVALWMLGRRVEASLGPSALFGLMFFGALVSSAAGIAAGALPALGASGMVWALIGAMFAARRKHFLFAEIFLVRENTLYLLLWMIAILLASLVGLIRVANASHVAGWLFGFFAGHLFFARRPRPSAGLGLIALGAISAISLHWAPWLESWVIWKFANDCQAGRVQAGLDRIAPLLEADPPSPAALNAAAWVMATSKHEAARDGNRAIELARQACAETDLLMPDYIDTLAAAFAEAEEWKKAEAMEREAISVAEFWQFDSERMEIYRENLKAMEKRKKIRE